ncbi:SagB/ThcOx family dehydrogenase [uncultured Nitrospira sp.]|uniref:SagB/ThcOx family dehydrogenase n=1 Tax=uncultured Nitrospira sp. TaxID=157176 RepID=UPI003140BDAB
MSKQETKAALDQVKQYHEQTKHEFNRYARSLGHLDWANQPDPFRRFEDAPLVALPHLTLDEAPLSPAYESLFHPHSISSQPITLNTVSRFFEYGLSLTAWKAYNGTSWALRSNPSSGNLHPTEGYLFTKSLPHLAVEPGLYHYAPKEHALEHRWAIPSTLAQSILQGMPSEGFLVGLTSIHWREAWKYGERAFRYCQHDIGHAIGTLRIAAATLGWNLLVLSGTTDETVARLLGLTRKQDFHQAEPEYPELLAAVWPGNLQSPPTLNLAFHELDDAVLSSGEWNGTANRLSKDDPVLWEIIDLVTNASWKSTQETEQVAFHASTAPMNEHEEIEPEHLAGQIIHQRRSAVAFDGRTGRSADRFFTMLQRIMPKGGLSLPDRPMPWDAISWDPTIHLFLFVHRIDGLPPGLYWLNRSPDHRDISYFKSRMHEQFVWSTPEACPANLPLYLLEEGNAQNLAKQLSCGQDIAGDSAFALGMVAEFDDSLDTFGPWFYKRLFWEAGLIGQVLYLEAEAAGIRSTGIGCFFDDPVHRVLGVHPQTKWQSLYHFTVGGPLDDGRLTTLPPYGPHVP